MKKLIVILISCMIFVQLNAQESPATSSNPEQDTTTVNIEVVQDVEGVSENETDETELTQESLSSKDMIIDSIPVVQIDTTQSPNHPEITIPSNEDGDRHEDNEGENIIVVLDDFQTLHNHSEENGSP